MKLNITPPESDALDLTPLIDIIFQLVIFFMIASTFVEDYGFNITLPQVDNPEIVMSDQAITLLLPADAPMGLQPGRETYASPLELVADMRRFGEQQRAAGLNPVAVIKADRLTPYEQVIRAWNAARAAGIGDISFKVEARRDE